MTNGTSLPPHLERLVRRQIAAGRYHSADDVIRAALQLLEASAPAGTPPGSPDRRSERARPTLGQRWQTPGDWLAGSPAQGTTTAPARRNPRGLLADLRSGITYDDVRDARSELWSGLHDGGA